MTSEQPGEKLAITPFNGSGRRSRTALRSWIKRGAGVGVILLLMAGLCVGWFAWGWHSEQKTVANLHSLGATIAVRSVGSEQWRWLLGDRLGYLRDRVDGVSLSKRSGLEVAGIEFGSCSQLTKLSLNECEVSDAVLLKIGAITTLSTLDLTASVIGETGLEHLGGLHGLNKLVLSGTNLDDHRLGRLPVLPALKYIDFGRTAISDAGLVHLRKQPLLERIWFNDTSISDVGLGELKKIPTLRFLHLRRTLVTAGGIADIKEEIPELVVKEAN